MASRRSLPFVIVLSLPLLSCGQPDTETLPTETPPTESVSAPAPTVLDPTVIDPDHYTAEFENDRVRIVRITYGPGEESVMHEHPDSVAVYLSDVDVQMGLPDGTTMVAQRNAGQHEFDPAGLHRPSNAGGESLELVLVELKSGPSGPGIPPDQDSTVVDPGHYTAEFENESVRIVRIAYGPGEESIMHYHPDSVAVFLTDHLVQMTLPDGSTSEVSAAAGEQMFLPAGQHLPKNISDSPWELILVELK